MDTLHCQENTSPPVQQTTHPTEHPCLRIEGTAKAAGLQNPLHWPLEAQSHLFWGGNDAHRALHLLVLDVAVGQVDVITDRSAGVLGVTSGIWVELVVGEEGSVPGQNSITLALPADRCGMLLLPGS